MEVFAAIAIAAIIFFVAKTMWDGAHTEAMICMDCGTIGEGKDMVKGNVLIEIILWLCFIIPGLIYTIWRGGGSKVCSVCRGKLVPLDTPRGQQLLKQFEALP